VVSPENLHKRTTDEVSKQIVLEKGTSLLVKSINKFRHNKMSMFGLVVTVIMLLWSVLAEFTTPYRFDEGQIEAQNLPPTWYKIFMDNAFLKDTQKWAKATDETGFIFGDDGQMVEIDNKQEIDDRPPAVTIFDTAIDHLEPEAVLLYLKDLSWYSHLLGTDEMGQDIFSRVIYGLRLSLLLAITVTFISVIIGVIYGSVSGYMGGLVDMVMMRIVDFLFGVPFIFLVILLMVFFGRHIILIFVGLGLIYWIVLARIVRGQVLTIKQMEYVQAAITCGVSQKGIIFRHLIPNILGPVIVFSTLLVPQIMLMEAFLSFIGLGVTPPDVSLGILVADGAAVLSNYSWPILYPGFIFSLVIFSINFIGDGIRDALDPKSI